MSLTSLPTPCPAATSNYAPRRSSSVFALSVTNDDTANIDYTRAIDSTQRHTKPRRSSALYGKMARKGHVQIHTDIQEDQVVDDFRPGQIPGRNTLFSRPARKPAGAAIGLNDGGPRAAGYEVKPAGGLREIGQAKARMSVSKGELLMPVLERAEADGVMIAGTKVANPAVAKRGGTKRDTRRRTIFAPNDTTMITIHPGADSTAALEDTFQLPDYNVQSLPNNENDTGDGVTTQLQKPVRRPRRSLAAAPRRAPLQQIKGVENCDAFDVCGELTGKENFPPVAQKKFKSAVILSPESLRYHDMVPRPSVVAPAAVPIARQTFLPRGAEPILRNFESRESRQSLFKHSTSTGPSTQVKGNAVLSKHSFKPMQRPSPTSGTKAVSVPRGIGRRETRDNTDVLEFIAKRRNEQEAAKAQQYQTLTENLSQMTLYENDWLDHLQVAITEIVNSIFKSASAPNSLNAAKSLRQEMIDVYHQPEVVSMHRRLQASLNYGALARPKSSSTFPDLRNDLGLRRRFINLWLENYDEEYLRAAAEVVTARQIPRRTSAAQYSIEESELLLYRSANRRELVRFLETFWIQVSDVDLANTLGGSSLDSLRWAKSLERSLMLIWLLDQAKTSDRNGGVLFLQKSTHKSSTDVLRSLSSMLMSSVGDIIRTLKQMEYDVSHIQAPLDEVTYHVENLAVDFRDGLFLAHLAEILLYKCNTATDSVYYDAETITVTLPDDTQLQSAFHSADNFYDTRVLSQHLKVPCLGHAQKAFNVQVSLSALEGHSVRGNNVVADITADDIVHGHREKTLNLLWSLIGAYGLDYLIDWNALGADTSRVLSKVYSSTSSTAPAAVTGRHGDMSRDGQEQMLLEWATAHYRLARPGCHDLNLTTSFAYGDPYLAVLQNHRHCLPEMRKKDPSLGDLSLKGYLQALGCSTTWTKQLCDKVGHIPSKETTISNLALLASRLIPMIEQHFAASKIQKWFRTIQLRKQIPSFLARVSRVRQCREQRAVVVLQRAWRAHVLNQWDRAFVPFQAHVRGFMARQANLLLYNLSFRNEAPLRVMGGW